MGSNTETITLKAMAALCVGARTFRDDFPGGPSRCIRQRVDVARRLMASATGCASRFVAAGGSERCVPGDLQPYFSSVSLCAVSLMAALSGAHRLRKLEDAAGIISAVLVRCLLRLQKGRKKIQKQKGAVRRSPGCWRVVVQISREGSTSAESCLE